MKKRHNPDPRIKLVIAGSTDEFGDTKKIREGIKLWNPDAVLKIIEGADHFYWGKSGEVQTEIEQYLDNLDT